MKIYSDRLPALDYKDVYIIPQYTEVTSRNTVDVSVTVRGATGLPVISANMDTVTDARMAAAMDSAGAFGAMHRFMTIEEGVQQYRQYLHGSYQKTFVSVGVNEESLHRARALYDLGARQFIIDIAHGHSRMMKNMLSWMKETCPDAFLVAGNVATSDGTEDLINWGADAIKIGIGPGAVCTTKNVTGVTVPQFTAVLECARVVRYYNREHSNQPPVIAIADGGVTEIGDIAKALGAGAHMVMCGRLFAAAQETPGPRVFGKKVYRGMASRDAMATIRKESSLPTAEGISTLIEEQTRPVEEILRDIKGGLQSAFSYSNAVNLEQFYGNCEFGIRKTEMK